MIGVFKIHEEFTMSGYGGLLNQNYLLIQKKFDDLEVEFFYYIKPTEPDCYFIVRIAGADRRLFDDSMEVFAENMWFTKLGFEQARAFLRRTPDLNDYC